jgi:hypothetical protein
MTNPNHEDIHLRAAEIEQIVIMVRLDLYNRGVAYGRYLEEMDGAICPVSSLSSISRILRRNGLTYRRTDFY